MHINGKQRLTTGLWTRQRGGSSSVPDYAVISSEHLSSVISLHIDDQGVLGGGSDHNWLILDLSDCFVRMKRIFYGSVRKDQWNISDDQDWSAYQEHVRNSVMAMNADNVNTLSSAVASAILAALRAEIGLKSSTARKLPRNLPPELVSELKTKRSLEKSWKTLNSASANIPSARVQAAEQLFLDQKARVSDLLHLHRKHRRTSIMEQCSGNSSLVSCFSKG